MLPTPICALLGRQAGQPCEVGLAGMLGTPLALGLGQEPFGVYGVEEAVEERPSGVAGQVAAVMPRMHDVGTDAAAQGHLGGLETGLHG